VEYFRAGLTDCKYFNGYRVRDNQRTQVCNQCFNLTCQSAATWRIIMYQIGNCACSTQKLHIFWRSMIIFLPVCCLLINCIGFGKQFFLLNFYDVTWHRKVKLVTPMRLEPDNSKTAGDRDSVPKYHQKEMAYGVSNGHVTDVVTWPRKVKLVSPICLECNMSKIAGNAI